MKKDREGKTIFKKKGRPNLLSYNLMKKLNTIMSGTRAAGITISSQNCSGKIRQFNLWERKWEIVGTSRRLGLRCFKSMNWAKGEARQG